MSAIGWKTLFKKAGPFNATAQRSAIGLELGLQSLNMVQLDQDSTGQIAIYDWASIPFSANRDDILDSSVNFNALLKQARERASFSGKKINAMMPASELKIMSVNYTVDPGQSVDMAIASIIADRLDGDLADYVIDYLPVRSNEETNKGLAVVAVAKYDRVLRFLDRLGQAGLNVQALDIGPAAIKRLVTAIHKPKQGETVLVINFGMTKSYLSIISGRRLLFDESVDFGERYLIEGVSSTLDIPQNIAKTQIQNLGLGKDVTCSLNANEQDVADTVLQILKPSFKSLADSLKRALVYAVAETRGEPISQIYIVGGIARWRGVEQVLSRLLDLPVSVLSDPLIRFGKTASRQEDHLCIAHPELALATGLALRDLKIYG